jgi:hypothetical protein
MYCNYQSTQNHHAYYVKGSNTKVGNNVIVNNIIRAMQNLRKYQKDMPANYPTVIEINSVSNLLIRSLKKKQ